LLFKGFKLLPSRTAFSRLHADLCFDEQKIDSLHFSILHGPLATDTCEFSSVLNLTGVSQGKHALTAELYESWSSTEKLTQTSKTVDVDYVPVKRADRAINVRIIRSNAGRDLAVVSDEEKHIYREINEQIRRDASNLRDKWQNIGSIGTIHRGFI
jgi:hypothetical protein